MIILLDGCSTSGKTTYSVKLSKDLNYKYISYDDMWIKMHKENPKLSEEEITNLTGNKVIKYISKHDNVIVDNPVISPFDHPKNVQKYLIYSSPKQLIKNFIKRSTYHPSSVKLVMNCFSNYYVETDNPEDAIDKINVEDIFEFLKLNPDEFKEGENFQEFINRVCSKIGFRDDDRIIYIKPRYNYDKVIVMDKELISDEKLLDIRLGGYYYKYRKYKQKYINSKKLN
jgi:hypothetical protein